MSSKNQWTGENNLELPKTRRLPPTAKIAHWGGLIMALNSAMPYIPRFDILKVQDTALV